MCRKYEWAWSLASDYGCQSLSMPMAGSLAAHRMGVDPLEAVAASTENRRRP